MIRVNLQGVKRKKRREIDAGNLLLLIPLLILAGLYVHHRTLSHRIGELKAGIQRADAEVTRLKKEIGEVEKFKARKTELQRKVDIISSLQTGRIGPVRIFAAITETVPEKCWIDTMSFKGTKIDLAGFALNNTTVANFMTALGQSGRFRDVTLGQAEQSTTMGQKLVKFTLTFHAVN